jgi:hypothetical protein
MRPVLIDASSAILLYKADIFGQVASAYRLSASASVCRELTRGGYPGAETFQAAVADGTLACRPALRRAGVGPGGLHTGERDTLDLMLAGTADFVIIDDRRAAVACRRLAQPHINALLCPRILSIAGRLDPDLARDCMSRILQVGRYGPAIAAFAVGCDDARLFFFLP